MIKKVLDDLNFIKKTDLNNCHQAIENLADQCLYAWKETRKLDIPVSYHTFSSILYCGMGGSAYGARIIKKLYEDELGVPVDILNDYKLPSYVNENTLIIASSYSGSTEETISAVKKAVRLKAKILGISSGGILHHILSDNNYPSFVFTTEHNPSGQPRLGQGYMLMGQITLLGMLKAIKLDSKKITDTFTMLKKNNSLYSMVKKTDQNQAKLIAYALKDRLLVIIGAEFLEGAIHAIRNPMHETGKHFADYFIVPEANHHLMEGLSFPKEIKDKLTFMLINSEFYSNKNSLRMKLTNEIIAKNNIRTMEIKLKFNSKFGQIFELIQIGSFISYYLGLLHGINPADIPWVNYFKNHLRKESL